MTGEPTIKRRLQIMRYAIKFNGHSNGSFARCYDLQLLARRFSWCSRYRKRRVSSTVGSIGRGP